MGALVQYYAHTKHSLHWQCPVSLLTQRGRAWSSRDVDTDPSALETANTDSLLQGSSIYLIVYPKPPYIPYIYIKFIYIYI